MTYAPGSYNGAMAKDSRSYKYERIAADIAGWNVEGSSYHIQPWPKRFASRVPCWMRHRRTG